MDIISKISVNFSPADAETLFKKAVMDHLQITYGIVADTKNVTINFKGTMSYDQMDRGHGFSKFSGVEVTIDQATPRFSKSGPYRDR